MKTKYDDLNALAQEVAQRGLMTVSMQMLRDAYGARKLGANVRQNISDTLEGMGIRHFPEDLPEYQDRLVRLYRAGTPAAKVVAAVLTPSADNDRFLLETLQQDDTLILSKIRELLS